VLLGDLGDTWFELTHAAHGELTGEQAPVSGVLGRIHPDEEPGRDLVVVVDRVFDPRAADRGPAELEPGAEPGVGQHRPDQRVAGDEPAEPAVGVGQPLDRFVLA
jgi:hypothetical protein